MTDLRNFVTQLGMGDARSLLQSGNLVFDSAVRTGAELERFLETEAMDRLSLDVDFVVRTPDEWKSIIRQNPFRKEAERDPKHLVVMFLKAEPDVADLVALQTDIRGGEIVKAKGKQAYIFYPDGIGRSKLTPAVLEKRLGRGTGRNWSTVLRLGVMARTGSARLTPIAPRRKI
jgi:uncharacterized protein (DUF1697 family)